MPDQKWFLIVTGEDDPVCYPESLRDIVHAYMRRKRVKRDGERWPIEIIEEPAKVPWARLAELNEERKPRRVIAALEYPTPEVYCDLGGMARIHRPHVVVEIPGLMFGTAAEDVEDVVVKIERGLERRAGNECPTRPLDGLTEAQLQQPYYEYSFFLRVLLVGPAERDQLITALLAKREEAAAASAAFDAEYEARFPGVAAKVAGVNAGTHWVAPEGIIKRPGVAKA